MVPLVPECSWPAGPRETDFHIKPNLDETSWLKKKASPSMAA